MTLLFQLSILIVCSMTSGQYLISLLTSASAAKSLFQSLINTGYYSRRQLSASNKESSSKCISISVDKIHHGSHRPVVRGLPLVLPGPGDPGVVDPGSRVHHHVVNLARLPGECRPVSTRAIVRPGEELVKYNPSSPPNERNWSQLIELIFNDFQTWKILWFKLCKPFLIPKSIPCDQSSWSCSSRYGRDHLKVSSRGTGVLFSSPFR